MKHTIIKTNTPIINWDNPQWVQHDEEPTLIILTTGVHYGNEFEGMALPCSNWPRGSFGNKWAKGAFSAIDRPLTIIIEN